MSTRSIVRIIPRQRNKHNEDAETATPRYIYLYHHSDGYPSGVGRELERFLRDRNDGNDASGQPTWDGERIAEDLIATTSGYIPSDGNHGDVEYGYVIDCESRTLTCYDLDFGRRSIDNANRIKM